MPFNIGHRLGFGRVVYEEYYTPPLKTSQDLSFDKLVRSRSSPSVLNIHYVLHIEKTRKSVDRSIQTDSISLEDKETQQGDNRRADLYFQELTKARRQVLDLLSTPSKSLSGLHEISLQDMEKGIIHYLGFLLGLLSESQDALNIRPIQESVGRKDSPALMTLFTYSWTDLLTRVQIRVHHPLFELVSILYTFGLWCFLKAVSSSCRRTTNNEDFQHFILDSNISEMNYSDPEGQVEHNNDQNQDSSVDKITSRGTNSSTGFALDTLEKPSGILSSFFYGSITSEAYCLYRKAASLFRFVAEKSDELSIIVGEQFRNSPKGGLMWDQRDGILGALINQTLAECQALLVAKAWHHHHNSPLSPLNNQSRLEMAAVMRDTSEKYLIAYNSLAEVAHLRGSTVNKWRHYLQARSDFYKALAYAMMGDHSYRSEEDHGNTLIYFRISLKLLENAQKRFHNYAKIRRYHINLMFWKKHTSYEIQAVHKAVSSIITKFEKENITAPHRSFIDIFPELCEAKSLVDIETYQLPSADPLCCPHGILEKLVLDRMHESLLSRSPIKSCTSIECPIM